jgi:hypothetical protein
MRKEETECKSVEATGLGQKAGDGTQKGKDAEHGMQDIRCGEWDA